MKNIFEVINEGFLSRHLVFAYSRFEVSPFRRLRFPLKLPAVENRLRENRLLLMGRVQ